MALQRALAANDTRAMRVLFQAQKVRTKQGAVRFSIFDAHVSESPDDPPALLTTHPLLNKHKQERTHGGGGGGGGGGGNGANGAASSAASAASASASASSAQGTGNARQEEEEEAAARIWAALAACGIGKEEVRAADALGGITRCLAWYTSIYPLIGFPVPPLFRSSCPEARSGSAAAATATTTRMRTRRKSARRRRGRRSGSSSCGGRHWWRPASLR